MQLSAVLAVLLNVQFVFGLKVAVFEHAEGVATDPSGDIVQGNLDYYKMAAKVARSKGAEVIVFPEYGIFPSSDRQPLKKYLEYVPDPKLDYSNPCAEADLYTERPILRTLSCLARDNTMIVVANMGDIQPCGQQKDCPQDGVFQFNTNVAFGRNGSILAKYHKEHLFGESGMDSPPLGKQDPTFETDLGRFATFVCFDIVFQRIVGVSHWQGVKAVLIPTTWFNAGPLYNSIQHFQAWAIGNNVTLLSANIHRPGISNIGSGIVKGKEGALVYTFNPDGQSKLLIADLNASHETKDVTAIYTITRNGSKEWTNDGQDVRSVCSTKVLGPTKDIYKDYRCLEGDMSNFTLVQLTKRQDTIKACHNSMCCTLQYSADSMLENFFLGVNNGTFNSLDLYFWEEEVCFLARCDGMENRSCVTFPTKSETHFHFLNLQGNFSTDYVYPTVMTSAMRLLPKSEWYFENHMQTAGITVDNRNDEELLVVGLQGRPYDRDPPFKKE